MLGVESWPRHLGVACWVSQGFGDPPRSALRGESGKTPDSETRTIRPSPALNVVQVLASLVFVHVVQHCSATKPSKIGYPAQNFARAAFGGAKSSGNKLLETDRMDLICGDDMFRQCSASDVEPFSGQREGFPAKKGNLRGPGGPKGNLGGPGGLQAAYCSRKSLTLSCCCSQILLLFCCYC